MKHLALLTEFADYTVCNTASIQSVHPLPDARRRPHRTDTVMSTSLIQDWESALRIAADVRQTWARGKEECNTDEMTESSKMRSDVRENLDQR